MLRYLFANLWRNPLARIGFIAAFLIITFGLIFSSRWRIYLSLSRFFSSADWSDVSQHGRKPFAFTENEDKARALTEKARAEIHDLALETLRGTQTEPENSLRLLNGLHRHCGSHLVSLRRSDNTKPMGFLVESESDAAKLGLNLALTRKSLLKINAIHLEAAMQKKPDYLPAIELAQDIFRATCDLREVAPLLARALDYREYFMQKSLYDSDNGKLYEKNPELFHIRAQESFASDKVYRELIVRYFEATRFRVAHNLAQLQNLRNSYNLAQNPRTLGALIQGLAAEARHSTPQIALKCHHELYALDFPGITDRADYLVALAESALYAGDQKRTEAIAKNALKSGKVKDAYDIRNLQRMQFHAELILRESENISRF